MLFKMTILGAGVALFTGVLAVNAASNLGLTTREIDCSSAINTARTSGLVEAKWFTTVANSTQLAANLKTKLNSKTFIFKEASDGKCAVDPLKKPENVDALFVTIPVEARESVEDKVVCAKAFQGILANTVGKKEVQLASKTWKDVKTSPELSDNAFQNLAYLLSTTGDSAKVGCAISECKSGVDVLVCSFEPSLEDKTQLFPKEGQYDLVATRQTSFNLVDAVKAGDPTSTTTKAPNSASSSVPGGLLAVLLSSLLVFT